MSEWLDRYRDDRGGVTIPKIWIAVAVSILIHVAALWRLMPDLLRPSSDLAQKQNKGPMIVQLERRAAPRPPPPAPRAPAVRPQPRPAPPPPARAKPAPPPRPAAPSVLAMRKPEPSAPVAPPQPKAAPTPPRAQTDDLAAYIESRRRSREESSAPPPSPPSESVAPAPPTEDPNARANRIAAANLGLNRTPEFGQPQRGGGVFTIRRIGYDYAEFLFYGWNKDIRRNTAQVIEVRKGANPDIRIAVVRRMIAIIRDHEQGDFVWESQRLGRSLNLSARQRDTAGLEDFMMQEFFEDPRQPYYREGSR